MMLDSLAEVCDYMQKNYPELEPCLGQHTFPDGTTCVSRWFIYEEGDRFVEFTIAKHQLPVSSEMVDELALSCREEIGYYEE